METATMKEAADILKRLSPQNQAYFMTLVRVAEAAENSIRHAMAQQPCKPHRPEPKQKKIWR